MDLKNTSKIPTTGEEMIRLMKLLWPINRSISGAGLRKTLSIIKEFLPDLYLHEVKSGSRVLDWIVPDEWEITTGYLKNPNGETIADLEVNNLHILGYSSSVDGEFTLDELLPHLYSLPDQPEAIPYVTSYYQKNWGFCISDKVKKQLMPGTYKAKIESRHFEGSISYGELLLPGTSEKEVLISTYCCHPSMANNELSGPCVAIALAGYLNNLKERRFSYRFVFIPEIIGSAAVLENKMNHLKENVFAAFNLTCVGDNRTWSFMPSRNGKTYSDKIALHALKHHTEKYDTYNWNDRGSDESMYCAPGIDLPVVSVMRSKYGTYPEYHTSLDTIGGVVNAEGLQGSLDIHKKMIEIIENDCRPVALIYGEPQLGRRGLYPMISSKGSTDIVKNMLNLISYADKEHSLLEIADKCNVPFVELIPELEKLVSHGILKAEDLWN